MNTGYGTVVVCSSEKNSEIIKRAMSGKLSSEDQGKVFLFEPEELFLFLDELSTKEAVA